MVENSSSAILEALLEALENEELVLPTLPEVALEIRRTAADPGASLSDLSRVIGRDAALTARLLKVVNSPLLRGGREISGLSSAIARLGIDYSCHLAQGLAMEQMFQARTPIIDQQLHTVWQQSLTVAARCHDLARTVPGLAPDQAYLGGLLHSIGLLPALMYLDGIPALLPPADMLEAVLARVHPALGERLLREWAFPESLVVIPRLCQDLTHDPEVLDYAALVQAAILMGCPGTAHPWAALDWEQVPVMRRLALRQAV